MSDLDRLFYWRGISSEYFNYRGEHVEVPLEHRLHLLRAMGVDTDSDLSIQTEAYRLDVEPWNHWLPKLFVSPATGESYCDINFQPDDDVSSLNWRVSDLDGNFVCKGKLDFEHMEEVGEYTYEGKRFTRRRVQLGSLAPNYYRFNILSEERSETTVLAVCPDEVYLPEGGGVGSKHWGVLIQLYTLKSKRNWGIGDFTDLRELIEELAKRGADVIGLNPLHALSSNLKDYCSPYSPSDRRFINPLYIDPFWISDYTEQVKQSVDRSLLLGMRASAKVNYTKIRDLKYPIFELMFDHFIQEEASQKSTRFHRFKLFVEKQNDTLLQFSLYEAKLQRWVGARYILDEKKVDVSDVDVLLRLDSHETKTILFHAYLQWLAQDQLLLCQQTAKKLGMEIGLIRDLAVGADGAGSEVSDNAKLFCRKAAVGAPPDPLAQKGQNWGLPPIVPSELRKSGFKHYIRLLRANMQFCGALRIDHVMSLMRLWWCPPGETADHGAYVYYPFPELLGILCLESHLNKCTVVGEDLGVVPDDFREAMAKIGALSNKVFYFEKGDDGAFKAPEKYAENALAMVNNHDVPTLVSWWNKTDLELKDKLRILEEGTTYEEACAQRDQDKEQLMAALYQASVYPASWHGRPVNELADEDLVQAILLFVNKSNSRVFVLQLEDLMMMDDPVNVPGTYKEHANWQRKLVSPVSELFASERVNTLLNKINAHRKS